MSRDRKLTSEERILWGKVAKSARALPERAKDARLLGEEIAGLRASQEEALHRKPPAAAAREVGEASSTVRPGPRSGSHQPLEKPVHRKLAKGRLPIEARLDLHGLYQAEAHDLLLDFLYRAHARGLRHVLVITGKGSSMGSEGALRRAVPLWFAKPEFRFLISSYEWAARHHGGEGALYVRLSRAGRQA